MQPKVLVVDHFDSFTWNLVQLLMMLGAEVQVLNTNAPVGDIDGATYTHIVLSPGYGHPKDVRLYHELLARYAGKVPILGVCLGHQAIGLVLGGRVARNYRLMHGKMSVVHHNGLGLFVGLPNPITVMRYHSWVVQWPASAGWDSSVDQPEDFAVTAWSDDEGQPREVMAIESQWHGHLYGVQFHPESFMTPEGPLMVQNFLNVRI